jgi:hypothetical protein
VALGEASLASIGVGPGNQTQARLERSSIPTRLEIPGATRVTKGRTTSRTVVVCWAVMGAMIGSAAAAGCGSASIRVGGMMAAGSAKGGHSRAPTKTDSRQQTRGERAGRETPEGKRMEKESVFSDRHLLGHLKGGIL